MSVSNHRGIRIPDSLMEAIARCGPEGLAHAKEDLSEHFMLISQVCKDYPEYAPFFGINVRVVMSGGGWSPNISRYKFYTLTFDGIRQFFVDRKLRVCVIETLAQLKDVFLKLSTPQSMVCNASLLCDEQYSSSLKNHAISIFGEKTENELTLCINDSKGTEYAYTSSPKHLQKVLGEGISLRLVFPEIRRQGHFEVTCNVFAIEDCLAFEQDPSLLRQICDAQGKQFPPAMMAFAKPPLARQRAIEHQMAVLNSSPMTKSI